MSCDIVGVGGAIFDQVIQVSDAFIDKVPGRKGSMEPISYEDFQDLVEKSKAESTFVPGGCARNTLHGLARFGETCALLGMVGSDSVGKQFRTLLKEQGIQSLLLESSSPTAIVLSLVTPDGERTMRTFQGASTELRGHHLQEPCFEGAKIVYIEGYTLFNEDLTERAMVLAKEAGAKVAFDAANFQVVNRFKPHLLHLLETHIDILFANEEEALALTGKEGVEACDWMAKRCETAIVLMGPQGCFVRQGEEKKRCPAYPVQPLDTTGAGDLFASGFLHGYVRGYPLEICAHYGAISGRAVVQVIGPMIPHSAWEKIYLELRRELARPDEHK